MEHRNFSIHGTMYFQICRNDDGTLHAYARRHNQYADRDAWNAYYWLRFPAPRQATFRYGTYKRPGDILFDRYNVYLRDLGMPGMHPAIERKAYWSARSASVSQLYAAIRWFKAKADPALLQALGAAGMFSLEAYNFLVRYPKLVAWGYRHPWGLRYWLEKGLRYDWSESTPKEDPPLIQDLLLGEPEGPLLKLLLRSARWTWQYGAVSTRFPYLPNLNLPTGGWQPRHWREWRVVSSLTYTHPFDADERAPAATLLKAVTPWMARERLHNHQLHFEVLHALDLVRQGADPARFTSRRAINDQQRNVYRQRSQRDYGHLGPFVRPQYALADTEHITWIGTPEALFEEAQRMHHCVDGYAPRAARQQCALYHVVTPDGSEVTVEQLPDGRLNQVRGRFNAVPTEDAKQWVHQQFLPAMLQVPALEEIEGVRMNPEAAQALPARQQAVWELE